jgi:hypothetical protein
MEEREIRQGDFALFTISGVTLRLPIVNIANDIIYVEDEGDILAIFNDGTKWVVQNLRDEHTITFEPVDNYFILPNDMMYKILFDLTYEQIMNMCETNTTYMKYCTNEEFWMLKIDHKYKGAGRIIPMSLGFKTYREMYQGFFDTDLDISKANRAVEYGNTSVLKWLAGMEPPILPDSYGLKIAIHFEKFDVLKWMVELKPPILPSEGDIGSIAIKGRDDILEWLGQLQPPIYMNSGTVVTSIMKKGHFNILNKILMGKILVQRNNRILHPNNPLIQRKTHIYTVLLTSAISAGRIDVLEWLKEHMIISQAIPLIVNRVPNLLSEGVLRNKFEMVYWFANQQQPILANGAFVDLAVAYENYAALKYFESIGIFPPDRYVELAAAVQNHVIVNWFKERGIEPVYGMQPGIDVEAIKFLITHDYSLTPSEVRRAHELNDTEAIEMFARIGLFP